MTIINDTFDISKNTIFCILGKSGVGKNTIADKILETNPSIEKIQAVTTRPMRDKEKNGEEYIFVSPTEFQLMINNNSIMEHRKYSVINSKGERDIWWYGNMTPKSVLSLLIGTIQTCISIKDNYNIIPIYIHVADETRLNRIITRESKLNTPNYDEAVRRFYSDNELFPKNIESELIFNGYSFYNETDHLDETIENINNYIAQKMFDCLNFYEKENL